MIRPSLYSQFCEETGIKRILENEQGFATYHFRGAECYIEDIFVLPAARKSGAASKLADQIAELARASGCKWLTGSVNTSTKDPTASIKVLLAYGFKFIKAEPAVLWFAKEL